MNAPGPPTSRPATAPPDKRTSAARSSRVAGALADAFGGITAAMLILPMSLAYGVASGLGALSGLYGAITLGFIAAIAGGTRTVIAGPTAPMVVATTTIVANHTDNLAEVFTIMMLAGVLQLLLGFLRVGRYVAYAPHSVVSGAFTGVGIIIIVMQTRPLFGLEVQGAGVWATIKSWPDDIGSVGWQAFAVAVVALCVMLMWPRTIRRYVPAVFPAMLAASIAAALWLSGAPTIGPVPTGIPDLHAPLLSFDVLAHSLLPAATLALIGSIDTLLTTRIAESMTEQHQNPRRDLLGQGIGHIVTGIVGGLAGGASACTIASIRAGARSRASGVICALTLLAVVSGLGTQVQWVPHAVLAVVLIRVGWDFIDWRFVRRLHLVQREHLFVMTLTLALTVILDLVTAVTIGFAVAALAGMRQLERLETDRVVSAPLLDGAFLGCSEGAYQARSVLVALKGSFTVASSQKLIRTIGADIDTHEIVVLDFSATDYIDDSAALVVDFLVDTAEQQGATVVIVSLEGQPHVSLSAMGVLERVPTGCLAANLQQAQAISRSLLEDAQTRRGIGRHTRHSGGHEAVQPRTPPNP